MTQIVNFLVNDCKTYEIDQPVWSDYGNRLGDVDRVFDVVEDGDSGELAKADFMKAIGGVQDSKSFVVSDRAWQLLLSDSFGVLELKSNLPPDHRLIVVAGLLDVVDHDRSVKVPGLDVIKGLHVADVAESLAGPGLFGVVGYGSWLLCGSEWVTRYRSHGLTGLRFEPARVG